MMTATIFKDRYAELTHDNKETAMKNWAKTWGYDYWRNLWRYKEYMAQKHGLTFIYRTGRVYVRHGNYPMQEYLIDGHEVSKRDFFRSFSDHCYYNDIVRPKIAKTA